MSERYLVIEKRAGYTPLAELHELRLRRPDLVGVPMTYAGRLDPMAKGKLLILIGEECKQRARYDGLQKAYEFEVVLGVATDTGDCLGIPNVDSPFLEISPGAIRQACRQLIGTHIVPYPNFSSKMVEGKPLFQHAIEGTLADITIPETKMRIFSLAMLNVRTVPLKEVVSQSLGKISALSTEQNTVTVANDFRKEQIQNAWNSLLSSDRQVTIVSCKAIVGSGTYIRTLASLMGQRLGVQAFASSIHRSHIGMYLPLPFTYGIWLKKYV